MPSKTITAQYVNDPKPGGNQNYGSVKSSDGEFFSVKKAQLSQFQKGGVYTIDYDVNNIGGRDFFNVTQIRQDVPQKAANTAVAAAENRSGNDRRIGRLAIAKSMIEAHPIPHLAATGIQELVRVADAWWEWVEQ